ncbi:hypothetical protein [Synechococcus sp. UW105]|uniref:hypothetical protein n=1 Tax=Synechococcus sp. UW105 TaxID=337067 RepID=UPI000E0E547A|nr:hypothetical protein [Synechococcus sp. UW105]
MRIDKLTGLTAVIRIDALTGLSEVCLTPPEGLASDRQLQINAQAEDSVVQSEALERDGLIKLTAQDEPCMEAPDRKREQQPRHQHQPQHKQDRSGSSPRPLQDAAFNQPDGCLRPPHGWHERWAALVEHRHPVPERS